MLTIRGKGYCERQPDGAGDWASVLGSWTELTSLITYVGMELGNDDALEKKVR
jgi:hypothetical protein